MSSIGFDSSSISASIEAIHKTKEEVLHRLLWSKTWHELEEAQKELRSLNETLEGLRKTVEMMKSAALTTSAAGTAAVGIDHLFSTGINYSPAFQTALAVQNAAQSSIFGQESIAALNKAMGEMSAGLNSMPSSQPKPMHLPGSHHAGTIQPSSHVDDPFKDVFADTIDTPSENSLLESDGKSRNATASHRSGRTLAAHSQRRSLLTAIVTTIPVQSEPQAQPNPTNVQNNSIPYIPDIPKGAVAAR